MSLGYVFLIVYLISTIPHLTIFRDRVQVLISKDADIDAKDNGDRTPLDVADPGIIKILRQAHLDKELLLTVKGEDDLKTINSLIAKGVNGSEDRHGAYYYAWRGELGTVEFIIEREGGVNVADKYGCTLLHWSALKGHSDVAKLLVNKGANVNAKDILGRTPMHFAVMNNHSDILRDLINNGASIGVKDSSGKTPLDIAKEKGHNKIVEYLEEKLREGRGGRKRRHLDEDHSRHRLSHKPLAIDLSNQPEIAANSGARPYSWINGWFGSVKNFIGELFYSRAALPETSGDGANYSGTGRNLNKQYISQFSREVCISNNVGLGFFLLQSFLDKKCPLPKFCSATPEEALADTLNMMKEFKKTLEKTAKQSGVSVKDFDFFKVYSDIEKQVRNEKHSKIPNILYSAAEEAYPENEEFLTLLKDSIEKMCNEQQIVNNGYQVQNTAHPSLPKDIADNKPRGYLNDITVNNQLQRLR